LNAKGSFGREEKCVNPEKRLRDTGMRRKRICFWKIYGIMGVLLRIPYVILRLRQSEAKDTVWKTIIFGRPLAACFLYKPQKMRCRGTILRRSAKMRCNNGCSFFYCHEHWKENRLKVFSLILLAGIFSAAIVSFFLLHRFD